MSIRPGPRSPLPSGNQRLAGLAGGLVLLVSVAACDAGGLPPEDASNCNQPLLVCTTCHGSEQNAAPPEDTAGRTETTEVTVGAHQAHLGTSDWHREVTCQECHRVPTAVAETGHIDGGPAELTWGVLATADDATPAWDRTVASCDGVYCHGATLDGGTHTTPIWTQVDGTQSACGSCHSLPPPAPHPSVSQCSECHGDVVAADLTFVNPSLHINGLVELSGAACGSCHGNVDDGPAPPVDTQGNTDTALVTVGAHQAHINGGAWHRPVQCNDCHVVPTAIDQPGHIDAAPAELTFGAIVSADGAQPSWDRVATTCDGVYCHGTTLLGPNAGGSVARDPSWTTVDGTWSECGTTCHTTPPGGGRPDSTTCEACHGGVISHFDPVSPELSTWAAPELHINGVVDGGGYHDLGGWTEPRDGQDHHGSHYFLQNQQRDEHDTSCTNCHGANLDGGTSGVSCDNVGCHGGDWRSCTFCHGTGPAQINPPVGVGGETTNLTLAVGRHAAHLTASNTHVAFTCDTCHSVPGTGDVSHALGYVATASLDQPGHHGDVVLSGRAAGMTFNVNATQGAAPVTARGSCTGACHSNGNGGAPAVTPYWAGGGWLTGNCGNCHPASPTSGQHSDHVGEVGCTDCHPGAGTATHMNGTKNFTGGLTFTPNGAGCGGRPSCTGTCHGENHNQCW